MAGGAWTGVVVLAVLPSLPSVGLVGVATGVAIVVGRCGGSLDSAVIQARTRLLAEGVVEVAQRLICRGTGRTAVR